MFNAKIAILSITIILATISCHNSAYSFSTQWQIAKGGKSRILWEKPKENGSSLRGTIEIDLLNGWKTYWQNPGSGGMPPNIILASNIQKLVSAQILYPAPELIIKDHNWTNGYHNHVLLPFILQTTPGNNLPKIINGTANLAICKDLCIVINNNFSIPTTHLTHANWQDPFLIESAFANIPQKAYPGFKVSKAYIKNTNLFITLEHPAGPTLPQLFLASKDLTLGKPKIAHHSPTKTLFTAAILTTPGSSKKLIRYTAKKDKKAVADSFSL